MAWCDTCSAYRPGTDTAIDARCSDCGNPLGDGHTTHDGLQSVGQAAPWHFWLVVGMLAAYLLWRLVQGVLWLV